MNEAHTTTRPRRADARRNCERIVAAARAAVADRGGDVVLEDVAREAGVGIGTLYRHFPTRQALLEAVFLDEIRDLEVRGAELAAEPSPLTALLTWLRLQVEVGLHGHSMGATVLNAKHTEGSEIQRAFQAARATGAALLLRAQDAGDVRGEVEIGCLLRVLYGLALANGASPDPDQLEAMFALVVAGMRA